MEIKTCEAVKLTPTASGDVPVRCAKPAGHPEPSHEAKLGAFPVRWS